MKKKVPAVRYSKETQTYPLRGDPLVKIPFPPPSIPSPQLAPGSSTETFLQSSSMTSFIPNTSQSLPLGLRASDTSLPSPRSSMEETSSTSKISDNGSSFPRWIPTPRKFTIAANTSLSSQTFMNIAGSSFRTQRDPMFSLRTINFTPPSSSPSNDNSIMKKRPASEPTTPVLHQSYQDSLNFFGTLAAADSTPSIIQDSEQRRSFLKPRFSTVVQHRELPPMELEASMNKDSKKSDERVSSISQSSGTYSAASNARRYSNPFMGHYRTRKSTMKPRSVSQALSDISRNATLRTRFAEPEHSSDGITAVPWCGKSKCVYRCCMGCSVYDPICNISCCFPYIQIFWLCTIAFGFFAVWVTLFAIWGDAAWPQGEIFEFYTLSVSSYLLGWIFACINIPPTLGMFAAGILFGNMEWIHTRSAIAATTRAIVVAFVLLRAGLNTDAAIFKTRGGLISRMAFVPGICEMCVATMLGFFLLGLPWFWALLFGSIIAALSPLAIIYPLVWLRENGYGENKGVTSVLLMMYALDNITLVTFFGIFFTLTFDVQIADEGAIGYIVLQTLISILGAIGAGFAMGTFITFFPHRYDPYCGIWRTVLLSFCGLGTILLTHLLNWDGAGCLCTIVMSFTASTGWKSLGTPNCINPVNMVFAMGWHVLQPIALGLIGAEVNITKLDNDTMETAFIIIPCCMLTRFSLAFLMSGMADFNRKERLFIALLSMTKGTPQAALAPMTVDLAEGRNQSAYAKDLLDVCVLEVLITLPLGPLFASFMGTRLLARSDPSENRSIGTHLPRHESWSETEPPARQRFKSIVSRINTDNEFMLFTETDENSDFNV